MYGYLGSHAKLRSGTIFSTRIIIGLAPPIFLRASPSHAQFTMKKIADAGTCDTSWIGDGVCDAACNNPYCLNDGGDCLTGTALYTSSHEFWDDATDEYTYRGFSPLQQGDELFIQPYYNISDEETLFDDDMVNILKTILNANSDDDVWTALENIFEEPRNSSNMANTYKHVCWS